MDPMGLDVSGKLWETLGKYMDLYMDQYGKTWRGNSTFDGTYGGF